MKSLYNKYDGRLMTLPDDITEKKIASYKNSGRKPPLQYYAQNVFDQLVEQARKYSFSQIVYIDGERKEEKQLCQPFTPENMVIRSNELYAVRYCRLCAVGVDYYVIPLSDMEADPCFVSSRMDRFDDYGDHDSWMVDTYIEMHKS